MIKLDKRSANLGERERERKKKKDCSRIEDHKKVRTNLKISNEWWSKIN